MAHAGDGVRRTVLIIRLDQDPCGRVTGVIERVRTGEKARVEALADVGPVLAAMLGREEPEWPPQHAQEDAASRGDRCP